MSEDTYEGDPAPAQPRWPDFDDPDMPITVLGHNLGKFYFFDPAGQLRELSGIQHMRREGLVVLFGASLKWVHKHFVATDRDGEPTGGWSHDKLQRFLVAAAFAKGIFDRNAPQRGVGVWRDGRASSAGVIVHLGDRLWRDGEIERVGVERAGYLYPAKPRIAPPADRAATATDGRKLLKAFSLWRFRGDTDAELVLGWTGAAYLGGAPQWRAHLLVKGERGGGKTWLAELTATALGAASDDARNSYSEAGLRQALTSEARALVLDESEENDRGTSRVHAVVEMLRSMSSGEGLNAVRGTAGGQSLSFKVTGPAYLSAILPVEMKPQDRSRFTVIEVDKQNGRNADKARAAIEWARAASPALRARALEGWSRFVETFHIYRDAVLAADLDARQADQFATIMAGRDLLCEDAAPSPEAVAGVLNRFAGLLSDISTEGEESEGVLCLDWLFTSAADVWRGGANELIGEMLRKAMQVQGGGEYDEALQRVGLRLQPRGGTLYLLVANRHQGLDRLFRNTRWQGGAWKTALRYLDGVAPWPGAARFNSRPMRCTAVPEVWLDLDDGTPASRAAEAEVEADKDAILDG